MPHSIQKIFEDILLAIGDLEDFSKNKKLSDYQKDRLLQAGIERQIGIIGEALNRLKSIHPGSLESITDSHRIIGMRNILAHGYDVIDDKIVWEAVQSHIPLLKKEILSFRT